MTEMICSGCPRRCAAVRSEESGGGFCGMGREPVIAKACVHRWEEPCISGERGSGAIFFSGCALRCVFCQNYRISSENFGRRVSVERLREICEKLIEMGVHNINLVNPTHFFEAVYRLLDRPLGVPVVYNTGGYERVETLRALKGRVQIYLPDLKYSDDALAEKYSGAPDYFGTACRAIEEMYSQTGAYRTDGDGMLQSGTVIRHLILPGQLDNTRRVIDWVAQSFRPGEVLFSLMSQYIPCGRAKDGEFPELARTLGRREYDKIEEYLMFSDIEDGFFQELSSASESYVPDFDLENV